MGVEGGSSSFALGRKKKSRRLWSTSVGNNSKQVSAITPLDANFRLFQNLIVQFSEVLSNLVKGRIARAPCRGGIPSNTWFFGPHDSAPQTAFRSVKTFFSSHRTR